MHDGRRSNLIGLGLAIVLPGLAASAEPARTRLEIRRMTCGGCVAAVKLQLKRTGGVISYEVSLAGAEVRYDPDRTDPEKILESVEKTGFQVSIRKDDDRGRRRPPTPGVESRS